MNLFLDASALLAACGRPEAKTELSRKRREQKLLIPAGLNGGQGRSRTADTRIFSPAMVAGLSVTIGRQVNESKRLKSVWNSQFTDSSTFEQIVLAKL